jgi:hypothetical protein
MKSETLDWLLEHAASAYQSERDAADKIRDRINFASGLVITPLGGAAIFLAGNFKGDLNTAASGLLFIAPLAVSLCLLGYAVWTVLHVAAKGHKYSHPPLPSQLSTYIDSHPDQETALADLKQSMLKSYESAVDYNSDQNDNRTNRLLHATRVAIYAIPFVALSGLYHTVVTVTAEEAPLKVAVIGKVSTSQEVSSDEQGPESGAAINQYFATEACSCTSTCPSTATSVSGKQDSNRGLQGKNRKGPINSPGRCK